jgi:two-component sensor histidine kinase
VHNEPHDSLILAPIGRDATVAAAILAEDGYSSVICATLADALDAIDGCYCLVATEEALLAEDRTSLAAWVSGQPAWSDFPLVLLTPRGAQIDPRLHFLVDNAVALERPFGPQALSAAVRSAVRARKRQLEVKSFLDERDRADERQRLLIRELHHRVKNTLANVQAVLGATARSAASVDEFYRTFSARIQSLAQTHSFLTDDYWQTASLKEILHAELALYDTDKRRVRLSGPDVSLVADQAVPLGMAIHELATNSAKYGALSAATGILHVEWETGGSRDAERLSLRWSERDGPNVEPPRRKGFGTMLIERVLKVQLEADVAMDYRQAGLEFALSLPLKRDRLVPIYGEPT